MSIIMIEGFDWSRNTAFNLNMKYRDSLNDSLGNDANLATPNSYGRSLRLTPGEAAYFRLSTFYKFIGFVVNRASGIVGFHYHYSVGGGNTNPFVEFLNSAGSRQTAVSAEQGAAKSGQINVYNSAGTVIASGSPGILRSNKWAYVEVKYCTSNTVPANAYEVRINGQTACTIPAGTDTQSQSTNEVERIWLRAGQSPAIRLFDNFYWADYSGNNPATKNFLNNGGGCFIQTLSPTGNGSYSQFTPKSGANWTNVDETGTWDSDNTYNQTSTSGAIDTFRVSMSGQPYRIYAVQNMTVAKRIGFPMCFMGEVVKTGNRMQVDYQRFNHLAAGAYDIYSYLYESPPNSTGLWTKNLLESSGEFGYQFLPRISPSGWPS